MPPKRINPELERMLFQGLRGVGRMGANAIRAGVEAGIGVILSDAKRAVREANDRLEAMEEVVNKHAKRREDDGRDD